MGVALGKPDPEVLSDCRLPGVGASPEKCIVIEDAVAVSRELAALACPASE
jgi:beta-phosphoglucomutase-like phosphatase (HAD superfamily)